MRLRVRLCSVFSSASPRRLRRLGEPRDDGTLDLLRRQLSNGLRFFLGFDGDSRVLVGESAPSSPSSTSRAS